MTRVLATVAGALAILLCATPARAVVYPPGFEQRPLATGLTGATGFAFAPDGRLYVIEKAGVLKVVQPGATTATTLLDLRSHVNASNDRGLLGVAVDSSFSANGYIYLLYTYDLNPLMPDSDAPMVSRLTRVQLTPSGALADPAHPETVLIGGYTAGPCPSPSNDLDCIPSEGTSHSIGTVRADPDGTLWVGSGDASDFSRVDPVALRTYDEQSMSGKVLHVDRDGRGLPDHPFCPADTNLDHVCTKVHSKGFRNPFRFNLRPGGGLTLGDVGWNTTEELDLVPAAGGKSYGWPCYEGSAHTPGYRELPECAAQYANEGTALADVAPDYEYGRTLGATIIGGPEYDGTLYPDGYRGSVFVGDWAFGVLRQVTLDSDGRVTGVDTFASDWNGTELVSGPDGDLAYSSFGSGAPGDAGVYRIVYTPGNGSPVARMIASRTSGTAPMSVDFDGSGSGDPDNDPLTYSWDFGDGSSATGATVSHTYTESGVFTATLTVSDGRGLTGTTTSTISSAGDAPVPAIGSPADKSLYRDGDTIVLQGSATDDKDGDIPPSGLGWVVRLHHESHIHPVSAFDGVGETSFTALPDHDANSYYEIRLTATDSDGLTGSRTITIRPETVRMTLESTPPGADVSYAGFGGTTPLTRTTAIGFETTVTATNRFTSDGQTYVFDHWSDGGARSHDLRVPAADTTLRAYYVADAHPMVELAHDRPTTASGRESAVFAPGNAVDGNPATRWSSPFADGHWWQVDLGAEREVGRVELDWAVPYSSSYRILTSTDGTNFTQAATDAATGTGTRTTSFLTRPARYVRVEIAKRATQWGASFWEARVFGSSTSAGTIDSAQAGSLAFSQGLRWAPGRSAPTAGAFGRPRGFLIDAWVRSTRASAGAAHRTLLVNSASGGRTDGFRLALDHRLRPTLVVTRSARRRARLVAHAAVRSGGVHPLTAFYDGRRLRIWLDGRLRASMRYSGGIAWRPGRRLVLGRGLARLALVPARVPRDER